MEPLEWFVGVTQEFVADAGRMLTTRTLRALPSAWRRVRAHPVTWMLVLMLLPMLPSLVPSVSFWPVAAMELALGALVVVGMVRGWTNEAIRHALASDGGLYEKWFGKSRLYRRADALSHDIFTGLLIRR